MRSKERIRRTLEFENPDRIPRHCWILPYAEQRYPEAVKRLRTLYPDDIVHAPAVYEHAPDLQGSKYKAGLFIDEWGCRFHNMEEGIIGLVTEPLISTWE